LKTRYLNRDAQARKPRSSVASPYPARQAATPLPSRTAAPATETPAASPSGGSSPP
jgi:hypothetical protein